MTKALLLVLAFGAVAFAAPGFAPQWDEKTDAPLTKPETDLEHGSILQSNDQKDDDSDKKGIVFPALDGSENQDDTEAKNIAKRQTIISYPYGYRYGLNPYRFGYLPEHQFFEPTVNRLVYPYRNLLTYLPGVTHLY